MAGQILGIHFKATIGSMLGTTTTLLFPQHRKRIDEMRDDVWYEWDEYVRMAGDFHAKLGDGTISAIGQSLGLNTVSLLTSAGFETLEKLFGDCNAMSRHTVRGLPDAESIRTVRLSRDSVVLESDTRLPPPLLAGLFRGFLLSFGKVVTSEKVERKGNTVRFSLDFV
ncbi:hypothetical protein HPC49_19615 [Pyxidicoccus fallax]|uniref:Heme NO-binding domain-containing protein n=1 Tax=Pyxidicoccus fallax TaxID=394095 RepID=A0A848LET0_9BACT|nr:hypothetical protein [Pyxidicoccus fallax]NMO16914.1 hypothetical protein [Pyxidicoccus fallax]NPC80421.1 hypothetical protein [Pyxidicoccus fallax]